MNFYIVIVRLTTYFPACLFSTEGCSFLGPLDHLGTFFGSCELATSEWSQMSWNTMQCTGQSTMNNYSIYNVPV